MSLTERVNKLRRTANVKKPIHKQSDQLSFAPLEMITMSDNTYPKTTRQKQDKARKFKKAKSNKAAQKTKQKKTSDPSPSQRLSMQHRDNFNAKSWRCIDVDTMYKRHVPAGLELSIVQTIRWRREIDFKGIKSSPIFFSTWNANHFLKEKKR